MPIDRIESRGVLPLGIRSAPPGNFADCGLAKGSCGFAAVLARTQMRLL